MSLDHSPDAGRRVVQCLSCWWAIAWRGEELARAAGWRSRYLPARRGAGEVVRVWTCPSCYVPPAAPASSRPTYTLPAQLLEEARRRPGRAGELLEQLLQVDRDRAEAYARAIVATLGRTKRSRAGAYWATWMREHRLAITRVARGGRTVRPPRARAADRPSDARRARSVAST